jgi:hypothetical protein
MLAKSIVEKPMGPLARSRIDHNKWKSERVKVHIMFINQTWLLISIVSHLRDSFTAFEWSLLPAAFGSLLYLVP